MKTIKYFVFGLMTIVAIKSNAQQNKLSLQNALGLAKKNNKVLQVQYLEEKVANAAVNDAKGYMLPTVGLNGSYQHYFDRQVIFMPGAFVDRQTVPVVDVAVGGTNAFSTNVYLQQVILNERVRQQIRLSKLDAAVENQKSRQKESDIIVHVTENYYTVQLLKNSIDLHKQSLIRNQQALKDSRMLYFQGKALKVDTLRNYIDEQNLIATLSYLRSQLKVHMINLKNQLGLPVDTQLELTDSLQFEEAAVQFIRLTDEEVLANRPDVQQGRLTVDADESLLQQSRAMRLPTVSFVGSYQVQAQADDVQFDNYRWPKTSFIGLQANLPLFNGFRTKSKIQQSDLRLKQSKTTLRQLQENAITENITLQNELEEAIKQVRIQEKTVEAASVSYQMTHGRYQNGLSSRIELSDAELSLTMARMNQLNATYRVLLTKLRLEQALGVLTF